MKRDTALVLVLALLALLALGVGGATLDDPTTSRGDGLFGAGDGNAQGTDQPEMNGTNVDAPGGTRPNWTGPCLDYLDTLPVKLGLFLAVLALSLLTARRAGEWWVGVITFVFAALPTYLGWAVLTLCGPLWPDVSRGAPSRVGGQPQSPGNASGGGVSNAAESVASDPSLLLGVLLAVAIAAAILALLYASGDSAVPEPDAARADTDPEESDVEAIGRAAGRAADRIDDADDGFANEVYAAWVEMTEHLSVAHPESSTPAEFATAAVEAGMGAEDVEELTGLFEEVRYGDYDVTPEREERAVAALRRIEERYADETDGSAADGAGADGGSTDDDIATDPRNGSDDR